MDEIDAELRAARRALVRNDIRVQALEELLDTARTLTREFGRPASLRDLVATASGPTELERRRRLMRALRSEPEE